jgi:hypothetical protein
LLAAPNGQDARVLNCFFYVHSSKNTTGNQIRWSATHPDSDNNSYVHTPDILKVSNKAS